MSDSVREQAGSWQGLWLSPEVDAVPQGSALLSSQGSEGWPWSTPTGLVWATPPGLRGVRLVHAWLAPAITQLNALLRLPANWNSYGAVPIAPLAVRRAFQLLLAMPPQVPAPSIVPTPRGCVQLEWHQTDLDIEVEVSPDGTECFVGERDEETEFPVRSQLDVLRLRSYLNRLG